MAKLRRTKTADHHIANGPVVVERELVQLYSVVACPDCDTAITYRTESMTDEQAQAAYQAHRTERIEWGGCKAKGRYA